MVSETGLVFANSFPIDMRMGEDSVKWGVEWVSNILCGYIKHRKMGGSEF